MRAGRARAGQALRFGRFPKGLHDQVAAPSPRDAKVVVTPHRASTTGAPRVVDPNPQLQISFGGTRPVLGAVAARLADALTR